VNRLRQYVDRWCCWLWGGLGGRVTHQGGVQKYWQWLQVQTALNSKKEPSAVFNKAEFMPERTKMMQQRADYLDNLKNDRR
jgi:hypothetical protein